MTTAITPGKCFVALVFTLFFTTILTAQVGINTTVPSAGSLLDISSTDKGILVPRVDITDLTTIAPITGGSTESLLVYNTNTTTGTGFYFWDGSDWIALSYKDGDFHQAGTSTPPASITDDVFRTGDMAIGKSSPNYALDVRSDTEDRVLNIARGGSLAGSNYGIYVNNFNSGLGAHTGIRANVSYSGALGTQRHIGFYSQVYGNAGNTNQNIGIYNALRDGTGNHTGVFNSLSATEDSENIGSGNYISGAGNGEHRGVSNALTGTGSGRKIGNYTNITQGTGDNYGTYNDINNTVAGQSSYGSWNDINSSAGTNYAGWFDSYGTGSGVFYAAVFNRGDVVANESGLDNDFRIEGNTDQNLFFADASTDRVGIGTATPGYKLDVAGDINLTGTLRNTGGPYSYPDYVFETYFDGYSNFEEEYYMRSLVDVESFLREYNHLPDVQSREDVIKNGWNITEGIRDNLEKVEELFLHSIEASKEIKSLRVENETLSNKLDNAIDMIEDLTSRLTALESKSKS